MIARVLAVFVCAIGLGAQGCDGVGAPLVDRRVNGPADAGGCTMPLDCDPTQEAVDLEDDATLGAHAVDVRLCSGGWSRCMHEPRAAGDAGTGEDEIDGDGDGDVDVDAGAACAAQPASTLDQLQATCQNLRVVLDPDQEAVIARAAQLTDVNLTIESDAPAELTLEEVAFERVFVQLEGPVTLRIVHASLLHDVGVSARGDGDARVRLVELDGRSIAFGEPEHVFDGSVELVRCGLEHVYAAARTIELTSIEARELRLQADSLAATDARLAHVQLDVGVGTFSAGSLSSMRVDRCDALTLISTAFVNGALAACRSEPLRAYRSSVSKSSVDGTIDSDDSTWSKVRFGLHAPTSILGWGTTMASVAFCEQSRALRFGDEPNQISCSNCIPGSLTEGACALSGSSVEIYDNFCDTLNPPMHELDTCPGDRPDRPRP